MKLDEKRELLRRSIYGHLLGDSLGMTWEGASAGEIRQKTRTRDLFVKHGNYTDDGAMVLAGLDALKDDYDPDKVMRAYQAWIREGKYTRDGFAIGYGRTTILALSRYPKYPATKCGSIRDAENGNGSLMRILPFCWAFLEEEEEDYILLLEEASAMTHGHQKSKMACALYGLIFRELLKGKTPQEALEDAWETFYKHYEKREHHGLVLGEFVKRKKPKRLEELAATGYVMDTVDVLFRLLERGGGVRDTIETAIRLGRDTDTNAAIAGGLAALYSDPEEELGDYLKALPKQEMDRYIEQFNFREGEDR